MNKGYIKLHREILDWEWYDDINTFKLFIHCLLMANRNDKKYHGQIIKTGSFITGREKLAIETGLSVQQVRTALQKLELTNELTIKSTSKGTIIEVVNYLKYQINSDNQPTNNQQVTSNQPTSNQQVTTNKNEKNIKNDNNEKNNIAAYDEKWFKLVEVYPKQSYIGKAKLVFVRLDEEIKDKVVAAAVELNNLFNQRFPNRNDREKLIRYFPTLSNYITDLRYEDVQSSIVPRADEIKKEENKTTFNGAYQKTQLTKEQILEKARLRD